MLWYDWLHSHLGNVDGGHMRAGLYMVPSLKFRYSSGQFVKSQQLKSWKLAQLTISHMIPNPLVSSITWMSTWQHFLKARLKTSVESWVEQNIFFHKIIKKYYPNSYHSYIKYHMTLNIIFKCCLCMWIELVPPWLFGILRATSHMR